MKQVRINIEDAFGIGKFDHVFDFDFSSTTGSGHRSLEHSQTNIVYARNGTMKTSLAKALDNFSKNMPISDPLLSRTAKVEVFSDGSPIIPENIFVVKSEEEYFESDGMSLLLADKSSQERYADIMADLDAAQTELFEAVARAIGIRGGFEKALERFDIDFGFEPNSRLVGLLSMRTEVVKAHGTYKGIDYKMITDKKVINFLDMPSTKTMLRNYVSSYEKILASSEYFQEGAFDYLNAFDVQKSLEKNNFMKSNIGNWVTLKKKDGTTEEVKSINELRQRYETDKNRIFETLEKQEQYRKFDDALGRNVELRGLQGWMRGHKELVPYLQNYKDAIRQIWYINFLEHKESYDNFVSVYESHRDELKILISASRKLETEWKKVADDFKSSFKPHFDMRIVNKEDVILKQVRPIITLIYKDDRGGIEREIDADTLYRHVLSKGERRALYILCVMFELRMRLLSSRDSLVVFDDIADSFDYRNKYAIIEYLHDISVDGSNNIHMLLLTHNYDFFRAFRMRCRMHYSTSSKALEARRQNGIITLHGNVHTNEFKRIKDLSRNDLNSALTLIPLARNIIEYGSRDADFAKLTSILHVKADSSNYSMVDICSIIEAHINGIDLSAHKDSTAAQQKILDTAEVIIANYEDKMEHKIILSMATRILAETYIKGRFTTDGKILEECTEQTGQWSGIFIRDYPTEVDVRKVLRSVNIITPELLHINAFMYEPIIDMSADEVAETYKSTKAL